MDSKPTLFVTGHRGLLGSACVRQLGHKYQIITTERNMMDDNWVRYFFAEHRPDCVIHCAAVVGGVKANRDNPVKFLLDNMAIQNVVLPAAADYGVKRLVNIGTSCMYPRDAHTPVREDSFMTGPLEPSVSAYAIAKISAYALLMAYRAERGLKWTEVAPANLYGLGDRYSASSHVIPGLIQRFCAAKDQGLNEVKVWGDGSATREFLSADDCARAIGKVLDADNPHDLINIGTGEGTTIKRLVWLIQEVLGTKMEVIWDTSEPTGIPQKTFDISRIKSLGWEPMVTLDQGLRDTIHDYLTNPHTRH